MHEGLFKELGDNLMKRQLFDLALECWLAIHERSVSPADCRRSIDPQESDPDFNEDPMVVYKMGVCLHQLKRFSEAHESLEWGENENEMSTDLSAVDHLPNDSEVLLAFAGVLEDMGRKTEALAMVARVLQHGDTLPSSDGTTKGKAGRMNKRVLETQAAHTMQGLWEDVQKAEDGINNGDPWALDKFIHSAGTMIETFRLAKSNFTKNRVSRITLKAADIERVLFASRSAASTARRVTSRLRPRPCRTVLSASWAWKTTPPLNRGASTTRFAGRRSSMVSAPKTGWH